MPFPRRNNTRKSTIPFPKKQLFILGLCRICEPIAFMSIFPYVYFMIEDFAITTDKNMISVYAGMVLSAFTLAEFSCSMLWGKVSDRLGRKPIILTGLAGTGVSMLIFGFAPNLATAVFARALGGMLNGNIGVLQTTVAELVTCKEHQPRAYTIMPLVWGLGSIVGPALGGALARPVINYPSVFSPGGLLEKFPYLLANLVCCAVVVFSVAFGWLFLEETHPEKKHNRDRGVELGSKLAALFGGQKGEVRITYEKVDHHEFSDCETDTSTLIDESGEALPGYRSMESSPTISPPSPPDIPDLISLDESAAIHNNSEKPVPQRAFTRQVCLNILAYGILAYHTITFDQLFPVVLAEDSNPVSMSTADILHFTGGFNLPTSTIGLILTIQGLYSMLSTCFLFPFFAKRLGTLNLFRLLAFSYPCLYAAAPYIVLLPESLRIVALAPLLVWKCSWSTMSYPAAAILLANSVSDKRVLGVVNGAAASSASLMRAVGPMVAGALHKQGLDMGISGVPWWFAGAVAMCGAVTSGFLSDESNRGDLQDNDKLEDEEAAD